MALDLELSMVLGWVCHILSAWWLDETGRSFILTADYTLSPGTSLRLADVIKMATISGHLTYGCPTHICVIIDGRTLSVS